jgi:hypothetical protein
MPTFVWTGRILIGGGMPTFVWTGLILIIVSFSRLNGIHVGKCLLQA